MGTPQEKALKSTGSLMGNINRSVKIIKGLQSARHFGEKKGDRKRRKLNEKKQGHELF